MSPDKLARAIFDHPAILPVVMQRSWEHLSDGDRERLIARAEAVIVDLERRAETEDSANPPLVRDPEQLERYYAACPGLREYISGYRRFIDQQALEIAALKAKP